MNGGKKLLHFGWMTLYNCRFIIYYSRDEIYCSTQSENRRNEAYPALARQTILYIEVSVFVVFIVCTFRFSPISKEISSSSRQLSLISRNSFSPKTTKFGKHSLFSSVGKFAFSAIFTAYVRLMVEVTLVKNWSSWSDWSGEQIP